MSKPVAVVVTLLLVLTYLLIESQSSDQLPRLRMQQSLQAMQLHHAELNRDVLMARAGLLANYDPLVQAGRNLTLALEIIKKETAVITRRAPGIVEKVGTLASALDQKLASVEYLNRTMRCSETHWRTLPNRLGHFGDNPVHGNPQWRLPLSHTSCCGLSRLQSRREERGRGRAHEHL